jgi:hypothetical protein
VSTDWWLESSLVLLVGEGAPLFFLVLPIVALNKEFNVLIFSRIVACFLSHNLLPVFPTCTIYVLDILHVYFLFQFVVYMYFQIVRCMYCPIHTSYSYQMDMLHYIIIYSTHPPNSNRGDF